MTVPGGLVVILAGVDESGLGWHPSRDRSKTNHENLLQELIMLPRFDPIVYQ